MDMDTMRRLEREADERDQTAAVLEHWRRQAERRRFLAFVFNWRQVVDEPVAAGSVSRDDPLTFGTDPGAADSENDPGAGYPNSQRLGSTLVGPAGPQPHPPPGAARGPATPHHLPPPLATRISAGVTWT